MNQNYGLIGRRSFLNLTGTGGMALVAAVTGSAFWNIQQPSAIAAPLICIQPNAALKRLMDGNQRFVHQLAHPTNHRHA